MLSLGQMRLPAEFSELPGQKRTTPMELTLQNHFFPGGIIDSLSQC